MKTNNDILLVGGPLHGQTLRNAPVGDLIRVAMPEAAMQKPDCAVSLLQPSYRVLNYVASPLSKQTFVFAE